MSATLLMTMIARVSDGLPLATSVEGDDTPQELNIAKYTSQAKLLCRKLSQGSPSKCSLESGPYMFHYFLQKLNTIKRKYAGSRARTQLSMVHNELQDVQRIMVQNIEDVIHRGESLTILDDQAAKLAVLSKKYKEDARILNLRSSWFKIAIVFVIVLAGWTLHDYARCLGLLVLYATLLAALIGWSLRDYACCFSWFVFTRLRSLAPYSPLDFETIYVLV
uniref:Uncharacterized protein n=1 Tax=Romanomermis culicivorax TaxID=13658 RepID=A0A915IY86_ROMCU